MCQLLFKKINVKHYKKNKETTRNGGPWWGQKRAISPQSFNYIYIYIYIYIYNFYYFY